MVVGEIEHYVLIPFVQGSVFRHMLVDYFWVYRVLIPFVQGSVFRLSSYFDFSSLIGLNPFRTGQCLSTDIWRVMRIGYRS